MRLIHLPFACAVLVAACGGKETPPPADTTVPTAAPPAVAPAGSSAVATTPTSGTGKVWEVKMLGDDKGYRYDPASLTIKVGDTVRWTTVSGAPHNVTFWADSIPNGAAQPLGNDMPNTMSPLMGPLLPSLNDSYSITFAGVPTGTYHYYCTPHIALGMIGKVTIQ